MTSTRERYDDIRQAKDELELKQNELSRTMMATNYIDEVDIEKYHARTCLEQWGYILDQLSDLIAALQAELDNIDDQGGPDECDRAMAQEMKADMDREA